MHGLLVLLAIRQLVERGLLCATADMWPVSQNVRQAVATSA